MLRFFFDLKLHEEGTAGVEGTSTPPANGSPAPEVVVYGKPEPTASEPAPAPAAEPVVDRTAQYAKYKEEYKDLYGADVKSQVDRRLLGTKKALTEAQSSLDIARQFFGLDNLQELQDFLKNDLASQIAGGYKPTQFGDTEDEGGHAPEVTVDPADLATQAVALKERFPDFDLEAEAQALAPLMTKGLSLEQAYYAQNFQAILQKETLKAAEAQRKATIEAIRTKGIDKVDESVSKPAPAVVHKSDPSKWSKEELAEVEKKVMRGEKIYL